MYFGIKSMNKWVLGLLNIYAWRMEKLEGNRTQNYFTRKRAEYSLYFFLNIKGEEHEIYIQETQGCEGRMWSFFIQYVRECQIFVQKKKCIKILHFPHPT